MNPGTARLLMLAAAALAAALFVSPWAGAHEGHGGAPVKKPAAGASGKAVPKAATPSPRSPGAAMPRGGARRLRVPRDYPGLQKAVDAAAPFDTIDVDPGVYTESVVISSGQRGLVLRAPEGAERTILQGSGDARLVTFDEVDTLTTLQGFTLRNGGPQFDGGALYAYHSKVLIRDCVFTANRTPGDGGALALYESEARLENSRCEGNSARRGGGIFLGGGRLLLRGTLVRNNSADQAGGGLYCDDGATADSSAADGAGAHGLATHITGNRPTDRDGCAAR